MDNLQMTLAPTDKRLGNKWNRGKKRSDITKKRISDALKDRHYVMSDAHKKAIGDGNRGHVTTQEQKDKISRALRGMKYKKRRCEPDDFELWY